MTRREFVYAGVMIPLLPIISTSLTQRDLYPPCTTSPCSCWSGFHPQDDCWEPDIDRQRAMRLRCFANFEGVVPE